MYCTVCMYHGLFYNLSTVCTYRKNINSMLFPLHMVGTIPYGVKRVLLCTYPYFYMVFSIRQSPELPYITNTK
jgi:hypothetical protein